MMTSHDSISPASDVVALFSRVFHVLFAILLFHCSVDGSIPHKLTSLLMRTVGCACAARRRPPRRTFSITRRPESNQIEQETPE